MTVADRVAQSPVGRVAGPAWRSRPVRRARWRLAHEPRNAALEAIHAGRRAFVIGHGRSILEQDLTLLRDELVFCVNSFFYHRQFHEIAPDYLAQGDPALSGAERRRGWFEMQEKIGTREVVKLFNVRARRVDRRHGFFEDHTTYYVHAASPIVPPLWEQHTFPVDLTRPLANFGIVAWDIAIPAALYMGVKEIVLIGFDGGEVRSLEDYMNLNFYGPDPLVPRERYEANFERFWGSPRARHEEERAAIWKRSLPVIERTMAEHDAKIVNATPVGKVFDGIPRVSYEHLFTT